MNFVKRLIPVLVILVGVAFVGSCLNTDYAQAKSFGGGKFYKMTPKAPTKTYNSAPRTTTNQSGSFRRGMMGGLMGGALGGLLFGSMFGFGGSGMGILPLLLLAGLAYFFFKRSSGGSQRQQYGATGGYNQPPPREANNSSASFNTDIFGASGASQAPPPPPPVQSLSEQIADGLGQIRETDRSFDEKYFLEVASDVFFQVQAGWMRRDLDSYKHLLGDQLASEYARHFEEMRRKGQINKLESIAVRGVEIVAAGSDGNEDFVSVLFTASLLDYTVDDKTGALVDGDMNTPVKFMEEWTWARPVGTQNWRLEGIREPQQ